MDLDFGKEMEHGTNERKWSFMNGFLLELKNHISNKKGEREMREENFSKEGETYIVDEIGDDERYVFLTRESDGKVMQVFGISEELYERLLHNHDDELRVKFEHGRYKIIETI